MVYSYVCPQCKRQIEVEKPMSEASRTEYCSVCGVEVERIYQPLPYSFGWTLDGLRPGERSRLVKDI